MVRGASPRALAALYRDIATPAARICYEELQLVAAELPQNLSYYARETPGRTAEGGQYNNGYGCASYAEGSMMIDNLQARLLKLLIKEVHWYI